MYCLASAGGSVSAASPVKRIFAPLMSRWKSPSKENVTLSVIPANVIHPVTLPRWVLSSSPSTKYRVGLHAMFFTSKTCDGTPQSVGVPREVSVTFGVRVTSQRKAPAAGAFRLCRLCARSRPCHCSGSRCAPNRCGNPAGSQTVSGVGTHPGR